MEQILFNQYLLDIGHMIPQEVIVILYGISYILLILSLIGKAKIFTKAGEAWWKILIPIYNDYIFSKIIKGVGLFVAKILSFIIYFVGLFFAAIVTVVFFKEYGIVGYGYGVILWVLLFTIVVLVIEAMYAYKLAKAFGKGFWYALGYFFFPYIFVLMYGFGSYEYQYAKKEDNVVEE